MLGCKGLKLGRKLPINHYVSPGEGRGGLQRIFFWGGDGGEIDHMVLGGKRRGGVIRRQISRKGGLGLEGNEREWEGIIRILQNPTRDLVSFFVIKPPLPHPSEITSIFQIRPSV